MRTDEFYEIVRERTPVDSDDRARVASEAVLETLAETLTAGEAENVAAQLPGELSTHLADADHDGAGYDRGEFADRIEGKLGDTDLEPEAADRYLEGVTDAVAASLTDDERENLRSQLTEDVKPLFPAGIDRAGA